jgi:hypothetical protein
VTGVRIGISLHSVEERPYTSMGWETQRKSGRLCSNNVGVFFLNQALYPNSEQYPQSSVLLFIEE